MPSVTERQRKFFGSELARKRGGKRTRTGMSERQLSDFAGGVKSNMPKGAKMSPSGDIGEMRQAEGAKAGGGKLFKGSKVVRASAELPMRKAKMS